MSGINRVKNMFDVLQKGAVKYADYKVQPLSEAEYHDPENVEQVEKAEKIEKMNNKKIPIILMCTLLFSAISIYIIWTTAEWTKEIIMIALTMFIATALLIRFSIKMIKDKPKKVQVITGKAIYKDTRSHSRNRGYSYLVSIIPDSGEKVIYRKIPISREDYERVTEGTHIMVVNKGPFACIIKDSKNTN